VHEWCWLAVCLLCVQQQSDPWLELGDVRHCHECADTDVSAANIEPLAKRKCGYTGIIIRNLIRFANKAVC
jgi:hypothetical protein